MDWHAEEQLLWEREIARSKRDFEQALRAGLLEVVLPGDFKTRTEFLLTQSRTLIAESHALLETAAGLCAVWEILRIATTGKR